MTAQAIAAAACARLQAASGTAHTAPVPIAQE